MSKTYATVDEYVELYGEPSDQDSLVACLENATRLIDSTLGGKHRSAADVDPGNLMQVCRDVAHRQLGDGAGAPYGVTQWTQSATPYSESMTFANPNRDAYLTKSEKLLLGIGFARLASAPLGWSA